MAVPATPTCRSQFCNSVLVCAQPLWVTVAGATGLPPAVMSPTGNCGLPVQVPLHCHPIPQWGMVSDRQVMQAPLLGVGWTGLLLEQHVIVPEASMRVQQPSVPPWDFEPPEFDAPHSPVLDDPEGPAEQEPPIEQPKTTLIVRGFPRLFSQAKVAAWLERLGYANCFDFLLWFPPKASSRRRHMSYAFVNFIKPEYAQRLLSLASTDDSDVWHGLQTSLTIMEAKVQGFAENYIRYYKLMRQEGSSECSSECAPHFDERALLSLSLEDRRRAEQNAQEEEEVDRTQATREGGSTVVIRNLPPKICSSSEMADWLKEELGEQQVNFDFLLYTPPKGSRSAAVNGCGYGFVNFMRTDLAQRCIEELGGHWPRDSPLELNVVLANVQGYDACMEHFQTLLESGRCPALIYPGGNAYEA